MNILVIHEIDWINKVIFEPHHLAELFAKNGHNVFVIDCPDTKNKNIRDGLKTTVISNFSRVYDDARITLIHPPSILIRGLNRITHFFSCKNVIKRTILENQIDLIFLYGSITNGIQTIQIAKELNIPVIFRLLDIAHGLVTIPLAKNLAKKYESKVISNSLKVLTTTPDMSRYAIQMGAKEDLVEFFNLGINTSDFKPLEKDESLAKSLGISSDDSVIVFVGTIYPFAGLIELINDFQKIEGQNSNIKLLIVGGGPSYNKLKKLVIAKKLESKVILTNFKPQKEIPKYISLADICINPFQINYVTNRILPTKILEYFSCKKPVLSTPLKGTMDLLPSEEYGIVYSKSENFLETTLTLLNSNKKLVELGKNGLEYVTKNHDWKKITSNLISIFKNL